MSKEDVTKEKVMKKLESVMDPELYVSIVDLGLVYDIKIAGPKVSVTMTLTTMGCPLFSVLEQDIRGTLTSMKGVKDVDIKLVFDPPWSIERMTEKAKAMIGI